MKRNLTIAGVVLILAFAGWTLYQHMVSQDGGIRKPEQASATAVIDRIETRVSAPGVVEPANRYIFESGDIYTIDKIFVKVNSEVYSGSRMLTFKKGRSFASPSTGVVAKVLVKEGDKVGIGQPLFEVFDNRNFQTRIMVDELDLPSIKKGQQAQIIVNAFPDKIFMGKVTDIGQEGETAQGVSSFPVTLTFEEINDIRSGMTTEATIVTAVKEEALVVPIEAVSIVGGKKTVLVENAFGMTETRVVEIGIYSNTMVEIVSGLEEGEKVRLPQAADDLFQQLIPGGFPVRGDVKEDGMQVESEIEGEEERL